MTQLGGVLDSHFGGAAVQGSWLLRESLGRISTALERLMLVETEKMSPAGQNLFLLKEGWSVGHDAAEVQYS